LGGSVMTTTDNSDWCTSVARIDIKKWEDYLQKTIIPDLRRTDGPKRLLIFLFANVVMFNGDKDTGCCILSYHSAFPSALTGAASGQMQSYIVANFDATNGSIKGGTPFSGAFPTSPDIAALANAVVDWMDNPTTLNAPQWLGAVNGVTACQNVLEPSFPDGLTGTAPPQLNSITIHGRVYHVNDLAFKSFFYGDGVTSPDPNTGFQGAYSLFNSPGFSSPAAPCP
jgi:hypothetical protein